MKISFLGLPLEISDWSKKLKVVTLAIAMIALFSAGLTLFVGVTIPGLTPIAMGMVMLLLGIKEFNSKKNSFFEIRQVYSKHV